jgi:hypothetical protein
VQPIARGDFGGALCDKWQALAPCYCESMTDINRSFFTVVMTKEFSQEVKDCRNVDEVRYLGAGLYRIYIREPGGHDLGRMYVRVKGNVLEYRECKDLSGAPLAFQGSK